MGDQQNESDRLALLNAVTEAVYASSTTAVFFHTAVAEQLGLGATDEKTLLLLSGYGRLTAGEIAQHTGLTTASVTSLIDRLEARGFVHRVRHPTDRRRVFVELDAERFAELPRVFSSLNQHFADMFNHYSDDQLRTIIDFLTRSAERSRAAIEDLRQRADKGSNTNV